MITIQLLRSKNIVIEIAYINRVCSIYLGKLVALYKRQVCSGISRIISIQ